jgi:hypothetical protein
MFHHGTLLRGDNSKDYINELVKSINESNLDFTHSNGQFTKSSNDEQKIFTVYNRYTFGYDTLNVVALKSTIKDIVITNSNPRCGDHQYALKPYGQTLNHKLFGLKIVENCGSQNFKFIHFLKNF